MDTEQNQPCPHCGSTDTRRYQYGRFVMTESKEEFDTMYMVGGCEMSSSAPTNHCKTCGKDFGRLGGDS